MGRPPIVACMTDFGAEDFYAGALRGVLAGRLPEARILDVTHQIPAGDVRRGALVLCEAQPAFPRGTVFLAVVDPGVGGDRRAAAFRFPECAVVCPDNGLATFLMERFPDFRAAEIDPSRIHAGILSNTFHGRDLFAPAAALLASGRPLSDLGPALADPQRLPLPRLQGGPEQGWEGEVLYRDHFGNAVTSIGRLSYDFRELTPWIRTGAAAGAVSPGARVRLADGSSVAIGKTYSSARGGARRIALAGSNGLLEIAAWRSSAGASSALKPGARIRLTVRE